MKNLQMTILNKVGIDRVLHFAFGGWVACLGTTWYWAIFIAFITGLLKELVHDKWYKKSKFDWVDVLYTFLGGCVALSIKWVSVLATNFIKL